MTAHETNPPVVLPDGLTDILLLGTVEHLAMTLALHNRDSVLDRALAGAPGRVESLRLIDAYFEMARAAESSIRLLEKVVGRRAG